MESGSLGGGLGIHISYTVSFIGQQRVFSVRRPGCLLNTEFRHMPTPGESDSGDGLYNLFELLSLQDFFLFSQEGLETT